MDSDEFRQRAKQIVDYVAGYHDTIRQRRPVPDVTLGYLKPLVPAAAPEDPDKWNDIFEDIERVIMPGLTHWQSPYFHGYYPVGQSFAETCGDLLCNGLGSFGFSWITCPAATELEIVVMDWLAKMLTLPSEFLSGGKGGGILQSTASESTLVTMLTARNVMLTRMSATHGPVGRDVKEGIDGDVFSRLVAYSSDQAHLSMQRACMFSAIRLHAVESDDKERMTGPALAKAIAIDVEKGLIPFYCMATLGTTASCAFDDLKEIGPVCKKAGIWLHIDAAYAGSSFICPEFRPLLDGVEVADSFNFNPHKWLLTSFDCSALWYRDSSKTIEAFSVKEVMFSYEHEDTTIDFSHREIPFGHRFRALKLWFVLRLYGVNGLQAYVRKHVYLAQEFEKLVAADDRFEVTHPVTHGLVCFRLRQCSNDLNALFLAKLTTDRRVYLTATTSKDVYFLRFVVCWRKTEKSDILYSWNVIREVATALLEDTKKQ
ncbi:hypothetical protein NP493_1844g00005 [Ridgeia piscesae]|uniref:Aromatic-L-amino-acid decarboxylase n=1 Tax=Ridgeia piscesae TaxID=27915 RepID=A0AAD9JRN4_RIDPI|nr:hypothetical protein NP493_1844g00005 [Ridgeia piscesae]